MVVLFGVSIALAGIGWWAWTQRLRLVNLLLDRVVPEIVIEDGDDE